MYTVLTLWLSISRLLSLSFGALLFLTRKYITTSFSKFGYSKVSYHTEWTNLHTQPEEDTLSTATNFVLTMSSSASPRARDLHFRGKLSTKIMTEQVSDQSFAPQSHDTHLTPQHDSTSSTLYKKFIMRCNYIIIVSVVIVIIKLH